MISLSEKKLHAVIFSIDALNASETAYVKSTARMKTLLMQRMRSIVTGCKAIYPHTKRGKEYYKCQTVVHNFTIDVINENIAARRKSKEGGGEVIFFLWLTNSCILKIK